MFVCLLLAKDRPLKFLQVGFEGVRLLEELGRARGSHPGTIDSICELCDAVRAELRCHHLRGRQERSGAKERHMTGCLFISVTQSPTHEWD